MNGKPVWSKPMGALKTRKNWGSAASPVLHGERVYLFNDNDDQRLSPRTTAHGHGDLARARVEGTNWSTPFVWENEVRTEIVTSGPSVRSF